MLSGALLPYLLIAHVMVGGGFEGGLTVLGQETSLADCTAAKQEFLATMRTFRPDQIVCVRGYYPTH